MRNRVLSLLDTVMQALAEVNVHGERDTTLLTDCHYSLAAIQNALLESLSKDRFSSAYEKSLDTAAEIVEHMAAPDRPVAQLREDKKRVNNILVECIDTLQSEPEAKWIIVFTPYKASMWDSMESIWQSASRDTSCECYVVPLPYVFYQQGGAASELQWEGERFPENVTITHYQEFDLNAIRPDVIFFHNPYDRFNYVTAIHPRFHSRQLKECTDCLVYVPYYGSIPIKNHEFTSVMARFPSMQQADYIFVGSKEEQELFSEYVSPQKLIYFQGSPKNDHVYQLVRQPFGMPEEWARISAGRRLVFYNTSLTGVLNHMDQFLDKMRYVFGSFRNAEGVCLLWRPHPLMEETLAFRSKPALKAYLEVKQWYIDNQIGIFDDSPQSDQAVIAAAGYYGDHSSLQELFEIMGKPEMWCDYTVMERSREPDTYYTDISTGAFWQGQLYFMSAQMSALFKFDLSNYTLTSCGPVEQMRFITYNLYGKAVCFDDTLLLFPLRGQEISLYQIESKKWQHIPLESAYAWRESLAENHYEKYGFYTAVQYGRTVYAFPHQYHAIVAYQIDTGEVVYFDAWWKDIQASVQPGLHSIFGRASCVVGQYAYVPMSHESAVLRFNLEDGSHKWFRFTNRNGCGFSGILHDGKQFWLFGTGDAPLMVWNGKSINTKHLSRFPPGYTVKEGLSSYQQAACYEGTLYALPYAANMALKVDLHTHEIHELSAWDFGNMDNDVFTNYDPIAVEGNKMYGYLNKTHQFVVFDMECEQLSVYPMSISKEDWQHLMAQKSPIDFDRVNLTLDNLVMEQAWPTDLAATWNHVFNADNTTSTMTNSAVHVSSHTESVGAQIYTTVLRAVEAELGME